MSEGKDQELGWWKLHWPQVVGSVLTVASIAATVTLAWRGAEEQPTRFEVAFFALLAASFQVSAAWTFSRIRRVDLTHARSSVRSLFRLAGRAEDATASAEQARAKGVPAPEVREVMNQLSVELSVLQEGLVDATTDWTDALPELLRRPKKTSTQKDSKSP